MGTIATMNVKLAMDSADFEGGIQRAQSQAESFSKKLGGIGQGMSLAVTAPLVGIAGMSVKSAADFESSMNVMEQVTGATAGQMEQLQAQALNLGAVTSFSAGEAAQAMLELGKAGLAPNEIMGAIGGTMDLAAAGGLDLAQAATIAANAMNAFQLPAEQVTGVANMLAAAANASSADVTDLAAGMQMAGAVFASNGQSITDLNAGLAILSNNGISGSDAGTSLKTMLMRLAAPTDDAASVMKDLGIQVFNADGSMRGFADIVGSLEDATKGLTDQQRTMALNTIFGADAIRAATILASEGEDSFIDMQKAISKEGAATATAGARMKGLGGAFEYLKGSIDSFLINTALPFLDSMSGMVRWVADLISTVGNLPAPIRNTAIAVGAVLAAAGPVLLIVSKLIPVFGMLGTVLGAIVSPIGLLVVAAGALVAVFATDFMGVRTAVVGMVNNLLDLAGIDLGGIGGELTALGEYLRGAAVDGDYLNDWLTHLPEPIQPAVQALGQLVAAFGGLVQTGDLSAFVQAITSIDWGGALASIADSLNGLAAGIAENLKSIDWAGALSTAAGWLDGLKSGVVAAVTAVDWGGALSAAGRFLANLRDGVIGAVSSIDWAGALSTAAGWMDGLKSGVVSAIQGIPWGAALSAAGNVFGMLAGGVTAALQQIPWAGALSAAAGWMDGLKSGVVSAVTAVDWGGALATAGDWLANLSGAVVAAIQTIPWGALLTAAGDFLAGLWSNVVAALGRIPWATALSGAAGWLGGLTQGIINRIVTINWGALLTAAGDFLAGLWGGVVAAVTSIPWLAYLGQAGEFLGGLTQGVINRITTINWGAALTAAGDYLAGLWGNVVGAVQSIDWGTALATATTWVTNLSTQVVTAIAGIDWPAAMATTGDAFAGLETAVAGALRGLGFTEAADSLDGVKTALSGLPAAIASTQAAFSGLMMQIAPIAATLQTFFAPAIERLQAAFTALPENLAPLMPKLEALGTAIGGLMTALQPFVLLIGAGLAIAADFGINRLTTVFETLPTILGVIIDQVTATINLISTTLTGVVGIVKGIIDGDWAAVWESAKSIAGGFSEFFRGLFSRLGTFMGAVARNISEPIINTLQDLGVDITPILDGIQKTFDTAWTNVQGFIQPVIDLIGTLQTALENFSGWLGTLQFPNPFAALQSAADAVQNALGAAGNYVSGGGAAGQTTSPTAVPTTNGVDKPLPNNGGLPVDINPPPPEGMLGPSSMMGGSAFGMAGAGAGLIGPVYVTNQVDLQALAYQVAQLLNRRR